MITLDTPDANYGDTLDPSMKAEADEPKLNIRRREFEDYASAKAREIDEQRDAWRFYHVDQWSPEQLKILKKRGQPPLTFDRTGRKIDSLSGTIRRLRADPKCYPNTPNGEKGAEVATQVIRTICDASRNEDIEVECCKDALIHGFGVDELVLTYGDKGDPDLRFQYVDPRTFFYDPRSLRSNFQDVRFHGVYKWADVDELEILVPGAAELVKEAIDNDGGYFTAFDSDRESLWVDSRGRVRLIDHWYKRGGKWRWCLHTGNVELMNGESMFCNPRGMSISKYNAFANMIDIDGDHYGFVRRLRGPQLAMNQHKSKAIHIMNTRQIKIKEGAVDDIEGTRREVARADGTIVYRGDPKDVEIIQLEQEFLQQTKYYEEAKAEIDTFGPNHQLIQGFGQNVSGRAANILQQAGLAELGPVLKNFRMWKLDRYTACWVAAQKYWTGERMLRVTNDPQIAQMQQQQPMYHEMQMQQPQEQRRYDFMPINQLEIDQYGLPILVNALGNIDVEIKVDEGPDQETVMSDMFDLLMALTQNNVPVPPPLIIEASNLPISEKQKLIQMLNQPDPVKQAAQQAMIQKTIAEANKLNAEAGNAGTKGVLNLAKAKTEGQPQGEPQPEQQTELDIMEQLAGIDEKQATAEHKRASARSLRMTEGMSPLQMMAEHLGRNADRIETSIQQIANRAFEDKHRTLDRESKERQAKAKQYRGE